MTEYRPLHQTQVDDAPAYRWVNCNVNAAGMATDKDSLGLVRTDPNVLRRAAFPDTDGLTMAQTLDALREAYGWSLDQRYLSPVQFEAALREQRGAMVAIVRKPLGDYCGSSFDGTHMVYVQSGLLFDPLCASARRLNVGPFLAAALAFGALVGHPGRIQAALTRANRDHPRVTASGAFFRYIVRHGVIVDRERHDTGGFSAHTDVPVSLRWPTESTRRTLVRIADARSAFDGWYVEPLATTVRYAGEL
jgi:hypothetical protein